MNLLQKKMGQILNRFDPFYSPRRLRPTSFFGPKPFSGPSLPQLQIAVLGHHQWALQPDLQVVQVGHVPYGLLPPRLLLLLKI
jgi:hypothetical protein